MTRTGSSFRDPAGFLFEIGGELYRQINVVYRDDYELIKSSGLYAALVDKNLLIPHVETDLPCRGSDGYKVIRPHRIPMISYPYEWCFSQLKAAALLTLEIQKLALSHGMSLKDASAYNVQFFRGQAVFIDTLSFEKYNEGSPWVAYQQYCRHFLAPLVLMAKTDIRLNCLSREFINGVPLDLASSLLAVSTYFDFSVLSHIHLHAKASLRYEKPRKNRPKQTRMSRYSILALLDSLESATRKLVLPRLATEWGDYYNDTNYSKAAFDEKKRAISKFLDQVSPRSLWDFGANNGDLSRIASERAIFTVAFDYDPLAVEMNFKKAAKDRDEHILPLLLDLTNPSPGIGWVNAERESLSQRASADCLMALALVHHLAISNNVPFDWIARYFASISPYLIIEFVPKEDSKTQFLLASRKDVFPDYHQQAFELAFKEYYSIIEKTPLPESNRTLYLMQNTSCRSPQVQ